MTGAEPTREVLDRAEQFLREKGARTESALRDYLNRCEGAPPRLIEAMAHSLFAPAKRLRPALALGACEVVCGDDARAMPAACAIEMIHTYSLIHDDLPCMDDDDVRRGQPSCHVQFGEALAILAGDTLHSLAFEVLAETGNVNVIAEVAHASGPHGMAGGQVLDLEAEGREIGVDELRTMHRMKTGALIRSAVRAGALLADADAETLARFSSFGEDLGLAFQIADDVLDVTGASNALGKTAGKDAERGKSTYPGVVGLAKSEALARDWCEKAISHLAHFGEKSTALQALALYSVVRSW